jgi:aryl-alcohol dehydrogenase-like predicted oxidoreductase
MLRSGKPLKAGINFSDIADVCHKDESETLLGNFLSARHRRDPRTPLEETLAALDQAVRAGKVRYLGFSNLPARLAAKAVAMQKANGWARFITGQQSHSLLNRPASRPQTLWRLSLLSIH